MNHATSSVRLSVTVPEDLAAYLERYRREHGLESRSAALADAIRALRDAELVRAYAELGEAQRSGRETYPRENADGLDAEAETWR